MVVLDLRSLKSGHRRRVERTFRGWTQLAVAKALGTHFSVISEIERDVTETFRSKQTLADVAARYDELLARGALTPQTPQSATGAAA